MKNTATFIPEKDRTVPVRKSYVAITKGYNEALVLNQLVYWSERTRDHDQYVAEENTRRVSYGRQSEAGELAYGWIYKSAAQLSEELMTDWSDSTTRKYLKSLVKAGYVHERSNPRNGWDRTRQYRVDLVKLETELRKKGYALPESTRTESSTSNSGNASSDIENGISNFENVLITETTYREINNDVAREAAPRQETPSSSFSLPGIRELMEQVPTEHRSPDVRKSIARAVKIGKLKADIIKAIRMTIAKATGSFAGFLAKCLSGGWYESWEPDRTQEDKQALFLQSRRQMPDCVLEMDAANGCKASAQVLRERHGVLVPSMC